MASNEDGSVFSGSRSARALAAQQMQAELGKQLDTTGSTGAKAALSTGLGVLGGALAAYFGTPAAAGAGAAVGSGVGNAIGSLVENEPEGAAKELAGAGLAATGLGGSSKKLTPTDTSDFVYKKGRA